MDADNEIGWLITHFNQLSYRLDSLLRLITRLLQSHDLEQTLRSICDILPGLVPLDWVGILIRGADGRMHLQQVFSDGKPDPIAHQSFALQGSLLQECIDSGAPLHIADVRETSTLDSRYPFLDFLSRHGRRDAVFMPVLGSRPVAGVAVFASCHPST